LIAQNLEKKVTTEHLCVVVMSKLLMVQQCLCLTQKPCVEVDYKTHHLVSGVFPCP